MVAVLGPHPLVTILGLTICGVQHTILKKYTTQFTSWEGEDKSLQNKNFILDKLQVVVDSCLTYTTKDFSDNQIMCIWERHEILNQFQNHRRWVLPKKGPAMINLQMCVHEEFYRSDQNYGQVILDKSHCQQVSPYLNTLIYTMRMIWYQLCGPSGK